MDIHKEDLQAVSTELNERATPLQRLPSELCLCCEDVLTLWCDLNRIRNRLGIEKAENLVLKTGDIYYECIIIIIQ